MCVCVYTPQLFIHSVDNGHLDHFQFLTITNKAAMNTHVKSLYGHVLSFYLGKNLGVEWLEHIADMFNFFKKLPNCSPN